MEPVGTDRRMIWERVFEMATCRVCGKKFAPLAQLQYLSRRSDMPLGQAMTCITCREAEVQSIVVDAQDWDRHAQTRSPPQQPSQADITATSARICAVSDEGSAG